MRAIGSILFLTLYLIALVRPLAPFLEYKVNQDFFAEVLCINKSNPSIDCEGQCALILKLKQSFDDTKPETAPITVKMSDYPIGFVTLFNELSPRKAIDLSKYSYHLASVIVPGHIAEILRPPCIA
jgi:hypothetical protein